MYINPKWRILTVGDGDLSFSASLWHHHQPQRLTATIFDDLTTLTHKYGAKFHQQLSQAGCKVLTEFDVTKPQTWSGLTAEQFDLVIFQFPLVPGFSDRSDFSQQCKNAGVNTINRRLLRSFLLNAINHFLDPAGPQLCIITSKDVKPYREWDIENSLTLNTPINYLGSMAFNAQDFPNYQIRNVDRDKFVKNTLGISYVWSARHHCEFDKLLSPAPYQGSQHCAMCRVGPFGNELDKINHQQSKRHLKMAQFEQQWLTDLAINP
ncbi:MAG: DUF2431 domain-containing protein [Gammaproteobacteria bacterium]|nr:DUF2431 domain-containing protein [Gammaproteobacteria bacterium]